MRLERIVLIHPCPLCPDPDDCEGHQEKDEAHLAGELVIWIPLEAATPSGDGATLITDRGNQ